MLFMHCLVLSLLSNLRARLKITIENVLGKVQSTERSSRYLNIAIDDLAYHSDGNGEVNMIIFNF